jgi:hypothetical protein
MQQREQQIGGEHERDDETGHGFQHGGLRYSRLAASA